MLVAKYANNKNDKQGNFALKKVIELNHPYQTKKQPPHISLNIIKKSRPLNKAGFFYCRNQNQFCSTLVQLNKNWYGSFCVLRQRDEDLFTANSGDS